MDLITHIPGIANSALFTPGANTPSPWNVPITGATDGNSPASATRNMAEIYNRVLFALDALIQASGMPVDHANWAQIIDALRSNGLTYAAGAGTANAHTVAFVPRVVALTDGMLLSFKAAASNTGAATLNVSGLGAKQVLGGGGLPLQGGEIVVGGKCMVVWVADVDSFVLIECTGASLQIGAGTKSQHAAQMSQVSGIVGAVRNLKISVVAASASANVVADEVVVETALGGLRYCLPNFNKAINLGAAGAGGMDTGAAPATGYVALYAIWNPSTSTAALLATNASAAVAPSVYGGANMPAGFTASALISVWPTNASGQFVVGCQIDRTISTSPVGVLTTGTQFGTLTSLVIGGAVPLNAKTVGGGINISSTASASLTANLASSSGGIGQQQNGTVGTVFNVAFNNLLVITAQTIYFVATTTAGTMSFSITVSSYTI